MSAECAPHLHSLLLLLFIFVFINIINLLGSHWVGEWIVYLFKTLNKRETGLYGGLRRCLSDLSKIKTFLACFPKASAEGTSG